MLLSGPSVPPAAGEHPSALDACIADAVRTAGGWLPFDRFMELALYAPGLGYYTRDARQFGHGPGDGSDFVTAPELSPLFGQVLAQQLAEALQATGTDELWEFGAGSGALAAQVLDELARLGQPLRRYTIVDLSGTLRGRQQARLAAHAPRVHWAERLPEAMRGVVLGNEVLDAMPVQLLARTDGQWFERGVVPQDDGWAWSDRPTGLRPPVEIEGGHDLVTEIHPRAEAFVRTLGERLQRGGAGAAFFIDYGFPEAEYYHPQRHMGTLVCHRAHRMDDDPLADAGEKDITAHVNFTGIALAAQDVGLAVLGYTSQGRFLLNCGLAERLGAVSIPKGAAAMKLVAEHEMGELFKVIGLAVGEGWDARGFAAGDRTHRL
jgi:SAM-dependent MidA family methyltransferase